MITPPLIRRFHVTPPRSSHRSRFRVWQYDRACFPDGMTSGSGYWRMWVKIGAEQYARRRVSRGLLHHYRLDCVLTRIVHLLDERL